MNPSPDAPKPSNFLRHIVERDLADGAYAGRRFAGTPGDATHHAAAPPDPARIRTRFPPEPNGYLHIGHAKSICLNFGIAQQYGGVCNLRYDDTNPAKEEEEYVRSIEEDVKWLGFTPNAELWASDYFDTMYEYALDLIKKGLAYVDDQSAEQIRKSRGTLTGAEVGPAPSTDHQPQCRFCVLCYRRFRARLGP